MNNMFERLTVKLLPTFIVFELDIQVSIACCGLISNVKTLLIDRRHEKNMANFVFNHSKT